MARKVYVGGRGALLGNTEITIIDGKRGKLHYRGYSINDLATFSTFEEVAALLVTGKDLPDRQKLTWVRSILADPINRDVPSILMDFIRILGQVPNPQYLGIFRTAISALGVLTKAQPQKIPKRLLNQGLSYLPKCLIWLQL